MLNNRLFDDDNGQGAQSVPQEQTQNVAIDYDRLAGILEGKQRATEDSVIKGYFKQQGLSEAEMKQAIDTFKAEKAARTPDINALNKQVADANARALQAETKMIAMSLAGELGVSAAKMPYLLKMADMTDVVKDGVISEDKLKENLNKVLNDVPELKTAADAQNAGFKIGADGGQKANTSDEELARIFGVGNKRK